MRTKQQMQTSSRGRQEQLRGEGAATTAGVAGAVAAAAETATTTGATMAAVTALIRRIGRRRLFHVPQPTRDLTAAGVFQSAQEDAEGTVVTLCERTWYSTTNGG